MQNIDARYRVAAYLRLSQEDGDKDVSDSIVSQKNIIEEKIKDLGEEFYIVDYYIDDGYTGLNTQRPAFQKMLLDIEKGKINSIITKDLSRLSRNSFEANYFIELYFLENNIRYISVLDNVDTGTKNSNNDMIQFKTLINDWYSKDISRKIKSSVWARKEKGMFLGSIAPYGYKKSKKDKHQLVINNEEARIVRKIFNEYNNGKGIKEIINILQKEKIPSPNNGRNNGEIRYKWREETIRRILCNKVYLGHVEYGKRIHLSYKSKKVKYIPPEEWRIAYNMHEPIIDKELFDNVQNKRKINKTIKRKKHDWELNGIVKCKECGGKMTLKVEYQRKNSSELKSKKICCIKGLKTYKGEYCIRKSKGLNETTLNEIVLRNINNIINKTIDEERLKELIINKSKQYFAKTERNDEEILYKQLKKIEEEIKVLYLDYKKQLLDQEDYQNFYQEKVKHRNRLRKEIDVIEEDKRNKTILSEDIINKLVNYIFEMKKIEKNIISDIIYDIQIDKDNKIYINYKYDIFEGG